MRGGRTGVRACHTAGVCHPALRPASGMVRPGLLRTQIRPSCHPSMARRVTTPRGGAYRRVGAAGRFANQRACPAARLARGVWVVRGCRPRPRWLTGVDVGSGRFLWRRVRSRHSGELAPGVWWYLRRSSMPISSTGCKRVPRPPTPSGVTVGWRVARTGSVVRGLSIMRTSWRTGWTTEPFGADPDAACPWLAIAAAAVRALPGRRPTAGSPTGSCIATVATTHHQRAYGWSCQRGAGPGQLPRCLAL